MKVENKLEKRPFFSLVIPTHNAENFIRNTLDSVVKQNYKDLEVIVADDQSTDNTLSIVDEYKDKLNIVTCTTDNEYHSPGNTRQTGLEIVTGEWVLFMDHDDELMSGALRHFAELIKKTNAQHIVCTNICQKNKGERPFMYHTEVIVTWLHGKVYNVDNLIKKYNIHFEREMWSHEDLYFNTQVWSWLYCEEVEIYDYTFHKVYTYAWVNEPTSITRSWRSEKGRPFIIENFSDYLSGLINPVIDIVEKRPEFAHKCLEKAVFTIPYVYFYIQAFKYCEKVLPDDVVRATLLYFCCVLSICEISLDEIVKELYAFPTEFNSARLSSKNAIGEYIETDSLGDFVYRFGTAAIEFMKEKENDK